MGKSTTDKSETSKNMEKDIFSSRMEANMKENSKTGK